VPETPFPRGVRDLTPNESLFRNELLKKIEGVFQRFGFLSIDTPTFEHINVLKSKGGIGEDTKLIFELKDEDLGLRYDHTVSLARYMAMHQDLPLPFKRYYIGKAWRREEPQRLRYREFTQADIDIVGGKEIPTDAEVIAAGATAIESIGMEYSIEINDRRLSEAVFEKFGLSAELFMGVARAIDKLDKIGDEKVADLLKGLGLSNELVDQVVGFINMKGNNEAKLSYAEGILGSAELTGTLAKTIELIRQYHIRGECRINFSLMRGLDYYTGMVFEYKQLNTDEKSSIGGGGRYDKLIGLYSARNVPAVGVSFGIDRILECLNFSSSSVYTYAKIFVACVSDANYPYALRVANQFRASGVSTDINMASRNLSNQFMYANALKVGYAVIIGDAEEKAGKLKLRNLLSGDEQTLTFDEALTLVKR
jgi:histidyl-tRNA synthetase